MVKTLKRISILTFAMGLVCLLNQSAEAQRIFRPSFMNAPEPNWSPYVIARGEQRYAIQSTPMEMRPYRPLHFYGNTVRRTYHRGTPFVMPRDIIQVTQAAGRRW